MVDKGTKGLVSWALLIPLLVLLIGIAAYFVDRIEANQKMLEDRYQDNAENINLQLQTILKYQAEDGAALRAHIAYTEGKK